MEVQFQPWDATLYIHDKLFIRLFYPLKNIFGLVFLEYFQNIFSETHFMDSGFINLEIKKCVLKMIFQNDFLSFEFPIPEISFTYEISILKSSKTMNDNFNILENVGVQKEI